MTTLAIKENQSQFRPNWDRIKRSGIATGIAELVTSPICTWKTYYQNSSELTIVESLKRIYQGPGLSLTPVLAPSGVPGAISLPRTKTSVASDSYGTRFGDRGIFAFFRASPPAVGSQIFSTASKYTGYQYLESIKFRLIPGFRSDLGNKILNAVISGVLTSLITHPIDAVRVYSQMKNAPEAKSLRSEVKTKGIGRLYQGYSKSFAKVVLGSALFFPMYDFTKAQLESQNMGSAALASFITGFVSTCVTHPLDYRKHREIYNLPSKHPRFRDYYRGLTLNLLRVVPHFVIVMTVTDYLNRADF